MQHFPIGSKGRDLILRMLSYEDVRVLVEDDLEYFLENREALKREKFPEGPLSDIVEIIITRSYWSKRPLETIIDRLREKDYPKLRDDELIVGYGDLDLIIEVAGELSSEADNDFWRSFWEGRRNSLRAFKNAISKAGSLKKWVDEIYECVRSRGSWKSHEYFEGIKGIGSKGINLLLRDMGYFDRVPIDIHERRFLLRTGIALYYGPSSRDPASSEFYSEALTRFCEENLKSVKIKGIPLDKSPGIVDLIVWHFACEREVESCKKVCSSRPRCNICPVRDLCLYGSLTKPTC